MIKLSEALSNIPYQEKESDIKVQAGQVATALYGFQNVLECPSLVNLAALRLSLPEYITVFEPTAEVMSLIEATDLHQMPKQCPVFMEQQEKLQSKQ